MNLAANITLFWQSWTQSPLATRLASVLLHFLWQGAALGTAAFLLLAALKQARPQVRYSALLTIFALMPLSVSSHGWSFGPIRRRAQETSPLSECRFRLVRFKRRPKPLRLLLVSKRRAGPRRHRPFRTGALQRTRAAKKERL
jgi:hypothetical protein